MKKFYCSLFILFFGLFLTTYAQKSFDNLAGIWQMCNQVTKDSGEKVMACSPIWKVLNKDGSFYQFMLAHKDGMCAISHEGTYRKVDDNSYEEHILKHTYDSNMVDKKILLTFRFVNTDMIVLSFSLGGKEGNYKEVWKRVK